MQNFHKVPSLNPLTALAFFSKWPANTLCIYICIVQKRLSARYAYMYAHFSLFYVFMGVLQVLCGISMKCVFWAPGGGDGVNGVRGPCPHETRSKQRWQPNAMSVNRYYWLSFTYCNHLSLFEKHVSEDDGMFTLRIEGFFRLHIHIYALSGQRVK